MSNKQGKMVGPLPSSRVHRSKQPVLTVSSLLGRLRTYSPDKRYLDERRYCVLLCARWLTWVFPDQLADARHPERWASYDRSDVGIR